jgi:nucleotide-binding universal stress UspA family protein
MFQKILVAIDHSEPSPQAFEAAITLAKTLNAQMMLINVLSPLEANYPSPLYSTRAAYPIAPESMQLYVQQWQAIEQDGLEFLRSQTEVATAAGIPTEFTQALGDPGHAICNLAKAWGANLIVIGRRGYKGLGELFIGSVSNYVMHHAPCSVLTVQGTVDLEAADANSTETSNTTSETAADSGAVTV